MTSKTFTQMTKEQLEQKFEFLWKESSQLKLDTHNLDLRLKNMANMCISLQNEFSDSLMFQSLTYFKS